MLSCSRGWDGNADGERERRIARDYVLYTHTRVSHVPGLLADCRRRRDIMLRVLGVRLLSRLLVLVCSLSLLSLLFLSRCGFNNLEADLVDTAGEFSAILVLFDV